MSKDYFIYGNQALELKEKSEEIIRSILPEEEINEYSVFHFDAADFYAKEKEKNERLLVELRNTCETVSWLSNKIVVILDNIQMIPSNKSMTASIEKALEEIHLLKEDSENEHRWVDESVVTSSRKKKYQISGKQLLSDIVPAGSKRFYVQLAPKWEHMEIRTGKPAAEEWVPVKSFLTDKLAFQLDFDHPPEGENKPGQSSEKLVSFLKTILPLERNDVSLILTANIQNTRTLNKPIFQLLETHTQVIKTTVSYDDFRPVNWIIERASKKNIHIKASIADLLIEICGTDLSVLNGEIEKLAILYPPDTKLKASDLLENVSYSKKFSIFRVADYLVKKDIKNALESMEALLRDHPSDSVSIFGIITSQFRRLLKVNWMMESGLPEGVIIKHLKLNQWIARQIIQQSQRYSCRELENIIVFLSKQDLAVKYHAREAMVILEQICYQICMGLLAKPTPIKKRWLPGP